MSNQAINDVMKKITDSIVAQLEQVTIDYQKPWFNIRGIPFNPVTKKHYNGINVLTLSLNCFKTNEYASYKQWQQLKAQVKKGEHGNFIVFYKPLEIDNAETGEKDVIPLLRYSMVFNADQVEGYEPKTIELNRNDQICVADDFARACKIPTEYGHDKACYVPSQDKVKMPVLGQFISSEAYYSVLFHEYSHATGHESRLARKLNNCFGDTDYAFEELIAELGSAFTMAYLSLEQQPRLDHIQYIKSWLKALEHNPKFIFKAAARAQDVLNYFIGYTAVKVKTKATC